MKFNQIIFCLSLFGFSSGLLTSNANAGVDHGNPNASSYYNMKLGLRLKNRNLWKWNFNSKEQTIRIDSEFRFQKIGYFIVSSKPFSPQAGWRVCAAYIPSRGKYMIYWIGIDCDHRILKKKFEILKQSALPLN